MSDSREPSYYEIALTNRQVLTVFVILLVCVVVAFLSGVWVGRKGGMSPVQIAEAQTINAGVAPSESPLSDLNFFSDAPQEAAAPETTADPAPEPEPATGAQSAFEPEEEPQREPEPAADEALTPPPAVAEPGAPTGDLVVQVLSTADLQRAEGVLARLRDGGYPAQLSEVETADQTMYRVRVGPYAERAEAQAVADRVRREYRLDTWITQ